jgi:hypothetical protein
MMNIRTIVDRHRFLVFSALTLGPAAIVFASGVDPSVTPFVLVLLPTLSAVVTAGLAGGGELGRLARRITRWRVDPRLYVAALGLPIAANLLIVALAVATGTPIGAAFSGLNAGALIVPLVVLLPALFEEFGWRGFGIPALGARPLLASALIVGIPFTLIHLPLHLPGHLYDGLPVWPSVLSTLSLSLMLAWAFSAGRGSALLAGLMHAAANGAVPLTWGLDVVRVWELRGIAYALTALALIALARRTFMAPAQDVPTEPELVLARTPAT